MAELHEAYIQSFTEPISKAEAIFASEMGPIVVEEALSAVDLYGRLLNESTHQSKIIANLIISADETVNKSLLPRSSRWIPTSAECMAVGSKGFDINDIGVCLVALQNTVCILKKPESKAIRLLEPGTLGFILNTKDSPVTNVVIPGGKEVREQKALVIRGRRTRR